LASEKRGKRGTEEDRRACVELTKHYLGYKIKKNEIGEACSMFGGEKRLYRGLREKPEGKRPLGRPNHRWEDNIKVDLQEIGADVDWVNLVQNRYRWWSLLIVVSLRVVP
jgi:hypothetical protein